MKLTKEEWIEYFKTELKLDDSYANAFAPTFVSEKIDKEVLCSLNNEDLKEIGITTLGERKLILLKIKEREERSREITSTKLSGEENLKHATHTPPKSSPGNTPRKKKSKKDEFIEKFKDCENIKEIMAEAATIIMHLEDKNNSLEKFTKMFTCPDKLRHSMENFTNRVCFSPDATARRQTELHTKCSSILDPTPTIIEVVRCVVRFSKIVSEDSVNKTKTLKGTWNDLKNVTLDLSLAKKLISTDIGKAIIELHEAEVTNAEQVYDSQIDTIWSPREDGLLLKDEADIKELCAKSAQEALYEVIYGQNPYKKINLNFAEISYLKDVLKIGKMFQNDTSKNYKLMFWVLYTVDHHVVNKILEKIRKEWPLLTKAEMVDKYCTEFCELFNIVSILSKHGPGLQMPLTCRPTKEDFQAYIKHLAVTESYDLSFVASTLYQPLD